MLDEVYSLCKQGLHHIHNAYHEYKNELVSAICLYKFELENGLLLIEILAI